MKILHISPDDKFIDRAMLTFESVFPGENEVALLNPLLENEARTFNCREVKRRDFFNPGFISRLKKYDLVVLHSMQNMWLPMLWFASPGVKFAWIGWGYDYYPLIEKNEEVLLLERTKKIKMELTIKQPFLLRMLLVAKDTVNRFVNQQVRSRSLGRIAVFSPRIYQDYLLVKHANKKRAIPPYVAWRYSSLEDSIVKNMEDQRVSGEHILVGNSATYTNNHEEVFELLSHMGLSNRNIKVPLSYGDPAYREYLLKRGSELFGERFHPLVHFIPLQEYNQLIQSCAYVIMNHKRQQALGNILTMLHLGAKVFVRRESPVYDFFQKEGAVIYSVQELEAQPELLHVPLDEEQTGRNIAVLRKHWSKEVIDRNTKSLVEFALSVKASSAV